MRDELLAPDFPAPETDAEPNAASDDFFVPATKSTAAGRDHWEQEKEKLTLALTERILRGCERVAFSELKNAPIFLERGIRKAGEIVLALLRRQARQIIRQEKPLVLQSRRRFELEDNEIRAQLRRLRDLLAECLVFDKSELQAAVAFAVRLNFDLITRPAATLEGLLYRRSTARQKTDIAVILEGFEDDYPFVACAQRFLMEYPDGPVTQEAFAALCRRAEREAYRLRPVPAAIADLQAYQKFCAAIGPAAASRLSPQTVLRMLRERGLSHLAENASPELAQQETWSLPEIEPILQRCEADLNLRAQLLEPIIPPPEAEIELSAIEKVEVETILEVEDAVIPTLPKIVYNQAEDDEPQLVERAKIEAQPPGPYPSMTRLIDEKSRQALIKKVFQKDLDAYLAFIERLEELQTWKEAKAFLDGEFKKRRVNPYSKEAVQLSDVVFGRYFAKGGK